MSQDKVSFPFVINEAYSLGYWLKVYGRYPSALPLCTYMDHGMTLFDTIPAHELQNDAPLIFKFSPRLVSIYKAHSRKPVYNLVNPAVFYRTQCGLTKSPNAKGTLFFVAHSTKDIDDQTDWNDFIQSLKEVSERFHPVDVCLHPIDVEKGVDKIFIAHGFRTVSAGPANSQQFISNFYNILREYAYVFSNIIGSYTFYSVEMGIPFSLYGEEPVFFNKTDNNIEKGKYESYRYQPTYIKARSMFAGIHEIITEEQKAFVDYELGKQSTISRNQASYLLYKSLLIYFCKHPKHIKYFKKFFSMKIPERYKLGYRILRNRFQIFRNQKKTCKLPELHLSMLERLIINHYTDQGIKQATLGGKKIKFMQPYWFLHSYDEIFKDHVYYFESDNNSPLIIDCGSNIGLSIIYFKLLFPDGVIIGFEPNEEVFVLTMENLSKFGFSNVEVRNEAVWTNNETLIFQRGFLDGHIIDNPSRTGDTIRVKAIRLKEVLQNQGTVDFLKIDIEGAELKVIEDCADELPKVLNLFLEFHNKGGQYEKDLSKILSILEKNGFRYYIREAYNFIKFPFAKNVKDKFSEYHNSLNVFAYNERRYSPEGVVPSVERK